MGGGILASLRRHRLSNKKPSVRYGYLFLSYWPVEFHRPLQILQAVAISLGYPSEFGGKTLLLKTPHTCITEY